jgi:hypothetical protein
MSWSSAAVFTPWISASGQAKRACEADRVELDAPDVIVGSLILGIDRERKRFDR